jgi:hypothetical protein
VGGYAGAGALLCWLFGLIGIKCGRAVGSQMARSDLRVCAAWARSGRFRLGAVLLVGLLVGAGCSDAGEDSGLPEITDVPTTSASPSSSGPSWTPEQQAVIDAVTAYGETVDAMSAGAPVDMKRIRSVAVDPWATEAGKNLLEWKAFKVRLLGSFDRDERSVSIRDTTATVISCLDGKGAHYVTEGPKPTPFSKPGPPRVYTHSLRMSHKRWLVSGMKIGGKC